MSNQGDHFIEKEVVLTIRVPHDFDREDERALDDEFATILEKQGWALLNSKEYRDVSAQSLIPDEDLPIIVKAQDFPDGWQWYQYQDGSGSLHAPDGKRHFNYDLSPYSSQGGIEYKTSKDAQWSVFWGTFDEFATFAEKQITREFLSVFGNKQLSLNDIVNNAETRSMPQPSTPRYESPDHRH